MTDPYTPSRDDFTRDDLPGYPDGMTRPDGSRQGDRLTPIDHAVGPDEFRTLEEVEELQRKPHDVKLAERLAARNRKDG